MNYKDIKMTDDYYNKLLEICSDVYEAYNEDEDLDFDEMALALYELTSKQFNPDNFVIAKYNQLKEDITQDLSIKKHLLEQEFAKLHEELQQEYERKFKEFKNDLLKVYKQ